MLRRPLSRLRARLLLLVALALAPPLLGSLYDTHLRSRDATRDAVGLARQLVHRAVDAHRDLVATTRAMLSVLAHAPAVLEPARGECPTLLQGVLEDHPAYLNLALFGPDGRLICSAVPPGDELGSARDLQFLEHTLGAGAFTLGDYQLGPVTRRPVLIAALPVEGGNAPGRTVLMAALDLAHLTRLAEGADLPPGSSVSLLDQDANLLAEWPDTPAEVGQPVPDPAARRALASPAPGEGLVEDADGDRLFASAPLSLEARNAPLIAVGIATTWIQAGAHQSLLRGLGVLLAGGLLAFLVADRAAERLVLRRVQSLVAAARRIAQGDLGARSEPAPDHDEIAELSLAFNDMAGSLEARERERALHLAHIERLNRVYHVLSGINGAILRLRDRDALLNRACRIAVDLGGFPLAWVGLTQGEPPTLTVAAYASTREEAAGYLAGFPALLDPSNPSADSPALKAVRTGTRALRQDIAGEVAMTAWRDRALALDLEACACLPLRVEGRTLGMIAFYAASADFFDRGEIQLLEEVASDTGLGLEYIEKERRLHYLANFDLVTGLANRELFTDRLEQGISHARHSRRLVAVIALEIRDLTQTADTLGNHAADAVLRELARRLGAELRAGDTVARLREDELGIALTEVALVGHVLRVMDALLRALAPPMEVDGTPLFPNTALGIALFPEDGDEAAELVQKAELAVHSLADAPRGEYAFYAPGLNRQSARRLGLKQALHLALERGELRLHYQPVVDMTDGRVLGAEALLRWDGAVLGASSPAEVIALAEETGLILAIGEWVLREACRQAAVWQAAGISGIHVAVNVSASQLRQPGFPALVRTVLQDNGLDPARLGIAVEITETELMGNVERACEGLNALRTLGVRVYVDDFGTGYSSLSYLRQLPVDVLKIDRSFVKDLASDPDAQAITRGVIALAHSLDLQVVAEGVETQAQLEMLRALQCDAVQGWLFSRARPPEEIGPLLGCRVEPSAGSI